MRLNVFEKNDWTDLRRLRDDANAIASRAAMEFCMAWTRLTATLPSGFESSIAALTPGSSLPASAAHPATNGRPSFLSVMSTTDATARQIEAALGACKLAGKQQRATLNRRPPTQLPFIS